MTKTFLVILLIVLIFVVVFMFRRKDQSLLARVVIVAVGAGIGLPLFVVLYYHSTYATLSGFIENVANAFGWPSEAVAAISVLMVVPVTIISGMIFSYSQSRRRRGVLLLTLGISAYWVLIWAGTSDHMVTADGGDLRCYTIGVDGVRYFDKQQINPRTGEMCQWVNKENLRYVQKIDEKVRSGEPIRRIPENEYADLRLFATGTSGPIPLVWFYSSTTGSIELFDTPGVHPIYGTNLQPITPEVALQWSATLQESPSAESTDSGAIDLPPILPGESVEKSVSISYDGIEARALVDAVGSYDTSLKIVMRSVGESSEEEGEIQVQFSVCNAGAYPTYFPISIYYTDKNNRSIYWDSDERVDFPPGYCHWFLYSATSPIPFDQMDFKHGRFYASAPEGYGGGRGFVAPVSVELEG